MRDVSHGVQILVDTVEQILFVQTFPEHPSLPVSYLANTAYLGARQTLPRFGAHLGGRYLRLDRFANSTALFPGGSKGAVRAQHERRPDRGIQQESRHTSYDMRV